MRLLSSLLGFPILKRLLLLFLADHGIRVKFNRVEEGFGEFQHFVRIEKCFGGEVRMDVEPLARTSGARKQSRQRLRREIITFADFHNAPPNWHGYTPKRNLNQEWYRTMAGATAS